MAHTFNKQFLSGFSMSADGVMTAGKVQLVLEVDDGILTLTPDSGMPEFLADETRSPTGVFGEYTTHGQLRRRDIHAAIDEWLNSLP